MGVEKVICGHTKVGPSGVEWTCVYPPHDTSSSTRRTGNVNNQHYYIEIGQYRKENTH